MAGREGRRMVVMRALYFLLVGWWAGLAWGLVAYALCATWVLLPLGTLMFNRLPAILTLKPVPRESVTGARPREVSFVVRLVWFFVIGWWLGLLAFKVGYLLCATIVLMPAGIWLLHAVPEAMTLKQAA